MSLTDGRHFLFLPYSGLRPDHHCQYGVLLAHTMHPNEAVRKPVVWDGITNIAAALHRTIAAITTLVYYSITTGALALFVI